MTIGPGTPAVRIWPRGTHRLLGVVNPKNEADAGSMLPSNLRKMMTPRSGYVVWGKFHVCPIISEQAGTMRLVTIDRADDLSRAE